MTTTMTANTTPTATLVLRLAAPLQSGGTSSRFVRRGTDRAPSRSGIIGLLAAASGIRRTDPLEDLLSLRIGVRVDQSGQLERDFQTARTSDGAHSMPLSYRFYLADAVFLAAIEGDESLVHGLHDALRRPVYPVFLGRKSCPPAGRWILGVRDGSLGDALTSVPWLASLHVQAAHGAQQVTLDTIRDCSPQETGAETVRDDPISFDPRHRQYGWRTVTHQPVTVDNPGFRVTAPSIDAHDPMELLGSPS